MKLRLPNSLPHASNEPLTKGSGFKQWDTKRRNLYLTARRRLPDLVASRDLPGLMLAFADITRFLAQLIPANPGPLPRGYTWGVDCEGEESFLKDGILLNPGFADPFPPIDVALQFAHDLMDGLLLELAQFLEGIGRGFHA